MKINEIFKCKKDRQLVITKKEIELKKYLSNNFINQMGKILKKRGNDIKQEGRIEQELDSKFSRGVERGAKMDGEERERKPNEFQMHHLKYSVRLQ